MRDFDFLKPATLAEAIAMRSSLGEEACLFAGGTALLLGMRQRLVNPKTVIALGGLADLRAIAFDSQHGLRVGALARHTDLARSPELRTHTPMLAHMAARMANPQVRNQGTLGGNLCYADPATDPPTALMALRASVVLAGPDGERTLAIEDFLVDYYATALGASEILKEIRVPPPAPGSRGIYVRHLRTAAEHRPVANLALVVERKGAVCTRARLVVGAATAVPCIAAKAGEYLTGKTVTLEVAAEAGRRLAQEITPISDLRGDGAFRRAIVGVIAKRAVAEAFGLDWKGAQA
ncbi:MAG: xanthine dehydrogenase family protein subunit M [Rhodospirillales bacterium]|nr:xanthine dehydrogenase family protein subunit M [Rhodospirillales bacterium]